jgi:PAS domain S-box-containing protein
MGDNKTPISIIESVDLEEEKRESEEKFSTVFKLAPYANIITNSNDGKVIDVNDAFTRITEYTREELIANSTIALNLWVDIEDRNSVISTLSDGSTVKDKIFQFRKKGGEILTGLYFAQMIKIASKPYIFSSILDVTKQREIDEKLKDQTDAMEASIDGIAILDTNQIYSYVNKAHAQIYGYEVGELIGASWHILYDPDELQRFEREIMPELAKNGKYQGRAIGKKKDGSTFPQGLSLTTLKDGGLICVVRDITEIKKAETALQDSQQLLKGIVDSIPVRVFWKDRNLKYLGCNVIFARDAGFTDSKDVIGKDDYQMVWKEQAEAYRADDRQVIDHGTSKLLIEEQQTTPDGKTIYLVTSKIPLRDPHGDVIGVLGTYMDITEIKKKSEEIEKMNTLMVGREVRMAEMKTEIEDLKEQLAKKDGTHG